MHNIKLIYDNIEEVKVNRRKKYITINIKDEIIDSQTLYYIAARFKHLLKFKYMKYKINLIFGKVKFADKITYLILDALLYDMFKRTNFEIGIEMEGSLGESIQSLGFTNTALYRTGILTKGNLNRRVFIDEYRKLVVNENTYRKLLSREELDDIMIESIIATDVASSLKVCCDDDEWIDDIAEVSSELVCNVSSHTKGECLLDINFSNTIKEIDNDIEKNYILVNISVINFSENNLYDEIKVNIKENKYNSDDKLYSKVYDAYETHKRYFDDIYNEDHFFMITAFQNHVTSRRLKSGNNGTGLTKLIQNIIGKAKDEYSYTMSGENIIFFRNEYLNMSEDKFIGFNKEQDYFKSRPDPNIISRSTIYIPGTIQNLLLIKEI
ncbi:hypothetical protein [Romboutsia sp. Marseille-P6047]|uniref:hypothetical protein n=1 Tax=Romboutsia sp. Marseille-P6047 TaxID=2161817 RepID=UPI000F047AAE|nr:hypothetical protein [Romboutsia sp. Marseille-P6047]